MITVYKYSFNVSDTVTLRITGYITALKIGTQHPGVGELILWAIVDTESEDTESLKLRIVGTGNPFDDYDDESLHFIDTVMDGIFVWHIFQIVEEAPDDSE